MGSEDSHLTFLEFVWGVICLILVVNLPVLALILLEFFLRWLLSL